MIDDVYDALERVSVYVRGDTEDDISPERQRLQERIAAVEDRMVGESSKDFQRERFLEVAQELDGNFAEYGNDFYHGTWGAGADDIFQEGIRGAVGDTRLTGETGTQGDVSLTYLPAWAFHYSLDQSPQTLQTVYDFVAENPDLDFEPRGGEPDEAERQRLAAYVESLSEDISVAGEDDVYTVSRLKKHKEKTNDFEALPNDAGSIPVQEVVFGVDYEAIADQVDIQEAPTYNELEAIERQDLGEVTVSHVPRGDLTAYVPHEFLTHYRDEHADTPIDVKSYDALMLKHELIMEDEYAQHGRKEFNGFWDGDRLGVGVEDAEWDDRPEIISVSY